MEDDYEMNAEEFILFDKTTFNKLNSRVKELKKETVQQQNEISLVYVLF